MDLSQQLQQAQQRVGQLYIELANASQVNQQLQKNFQALSQQYADLSQQHVDLQEQYASLVENVDESDIIDKADDDEKESQPVPE